MRFSIISKLVHRFYIFGGLLWGVLASAFFSIFRRQPTMLYEIFTQPHHQKASYGPNVSFLIQNFNVKLVSALFTF